MAGWPVTLNGQVLPVASQLRRVISCGVAPFGGIGVAFIGVVGAEFIMSRDGLGYEISFAYNNFDNKIMYPLILLILAVSIAINAILSHWEQILMQRRGRS